MLRSSHPVECKCSRCAEADQVLLGIGFAQGSGVLSRRAVEGKVFEVRVCASTGYRTPQARPAVRR